MRHTCLVVILEHRSNIDARGANALRACLPSHLFELFTATASQPGHQITVMNKHLRTLRVIGSPKVETTSPVPFNAAVAFYVFSNASGCQALRSINSVSGT